MAIAIECAQSMSKSRIHRLVSVEVARQCNFRHCSANAANTKKPPCFRSVKGVQVVAPQDTGVHLVEWNEEEDLTPRDHDPQMMLTELHEAHDDHEEYWAYPSLSCKLMQIKI